MSDLIHRSRKAKTLIRNTSLPKWQRLPNALQALSGLMLSDLPEHTREQFEADMAAINRELSRYLIEKDEDYQIVADVDLQRMLDRVDMAVSHVIAAELDRIVDDLDKGINKLPVSAIRETREHQDLMVPRLIEHLREVTTAAREGNVSKGNAHFFALFLLSEFQAEEAFPVILEVVSLPDELPYDLFGDAITSTLARIIAQFAGGCPELLDSLINNTELDRHVRWEAAESSPQIPTRMALDTSHTPDTAGFSSRKAHPT